MPKHKLSRYEAGYQRREDIDADISEGLIDEFYARQNRRPECAYVPTSWKEED